LASGQSAKSLAKLRFWTEQVKRAHLIRYGPLGNDLEKTRRILKHTQRVLRQPNGLEVAVRSGFV